MITRDQLAARLGIDLYGDYETSLYRRKRSRADKRARVEAMRCINGPLVGNVGRSGVEHGPVVPGTGKCQRCRDAAHARAA